MLSIGKEHVFVTLGSATYWMPTENPRRGGASRNNRWSIAGNFRTLEPIGATIGFAAVSARSNDSRYSLRWSIGRAWPLVDLVHRPRDVRFRGQSRPSADIRRCLLLTDFVEKVRAPDVATLLFRWSGSGIARGVVYCVDSSRLRAAPNRRRASASLPPIRSRTRGSPEVAFEN